MILALRNLCYVMILILLATGFAGKLNAAEIIANYDSNIIIDVNGDLLVRETITVVAEGDKIRRGIYRDFPRYYEDRKGKLIRVGFDLLSVKRDGQEEQWHIEEADSFTRVYIGNADVFIDHGLHTYDIEYRTDRQLRFFDTHDELFWNATGTEWEFPIEQASATVTLPPNIEATDTIFFTGIHGSTEKFATVKIINSSPEQGQKIQFTTTKPLGERAGLTVGVKMPKGSFEPIPQSKERLWFWEDNKAEIIAIIALVVVGLYYFTRWWQIGRDPPPGIIVARWEMPEDYSPALVNYVKEKGIGANAWKGLTSALLNLAVKGYVVLEDLDSDATIVRTDKKREANLPVGEVSLLDRVERYSSKSITIKKSNGTSVKKMHDNFIEAMEGEHRQSYYRSNFGSIAFGIFISVVGFIAIIATGGVSESIFVKIIPVFIVGILGTIILSKFGRAFRAGGTLAEKITSVFSFVAFGFIALTIGIGALSNIMDLQSLALLLICILGLVMLNALFFFLLGAPTPLGREKMDTMEGLETYLTLAEKDRMNLAGAPKMSPRHYETLLPYAVALGLEKPWSNAFQAWLLTAAAAAAGAAVAHYSPGWYRGNFSTDNIGDTFGDMAGNIQSSFTASLPTPKSSSSGFSSGGGFSGGGGGGGGGGGW